MENWKCAKANFCFKLPENAPDFGEIIEILFAKSMLYASILHKA